MSWARATGRRQKFGCDFGERVGVCGMCSVANAVQGDQACSAVDLGQVERLLHADQLVFGAHHQQDRTTDGGQDVVGDLDAVRVWRRQRAPRGLCANAQSRAWRCAIREAPVAIGEPSSPPWAPRRNVRSPDSPGSSSGPCRVGEFSISNSATLRPKGKSDHVRSSELHPSDQRPKIRDDLVEAERTVDMIGSTMTAKVRDDEGEGSVQSPDQFVPLVGAGIGGAVDQQNGGAATLHPVVESRSPSLE